MAEYSKSAQTRAAILEAAERLYWEKGYTATRMAAAANCPERLLAYHFGKKERLAEAVHKCLTVRLFELTDRIMDRLNVQDYLLRVVIGQRIAGEVFDLSPKVRRFLYELACERISVKYIKRGQSDFFKECSEHLQLGLSDKAVQTLYVMSQAATDELKVTLIEGGLYESAQEAADYDIMQMLALLFVERSQVDRLIAESREIFSRIHFTAEERFCFSYEVF